MRLTDVHGEVIHDILAWDLAKQSRDPEGLSASLVWTGQRDRAPLVARRQQP
jgi:hypothetical protein